MKLANDVMIRPDRFRDVKVKNIVGEFARGEKSDKYDNFTYIQIIQVFTFVTTINIIIRFKGNLQ